MTDSDKVKYYTRVGVTYSNKVKARLGSSLAYKYYTTVEVRYTHKVEARLGSSLAYKYYTRVHLTDSDWFKQG